jgi:hypothetical protein
VKRIVQGLGALLCLFALIGVLAAWAGRGIAPTWPGYEADSLGFLLRSWADIVVFGALFLGGFTLLRGRDARWWMLAALALALTKLGFDLALADLGTARGRTMRTGSVVAALAASIAMALAWVPAILVGSARLAPED